MRRVMVLSFLAVLCVTGRCAEAGRFLYRERPSYEVLRRQQWVMYDLKDKLAGEDFERILAAEVRTIYDAYRAWDEDEGDDVEAAQQQRQAEDQYAPDMLISLAMAMMPERKARLETLLVAFITDEKAPRRSLRLWAAGIAAHFGLARAISAAERICADDASDESLRVAFLRVMLRRSDSGADVFSERVAKGEVTRNQTLIEAAGEFLRNVAGARKLRRSTPEELLRTWLDLIGTADGKLIDSLYLGPSRWLGRVDYENVFEHSARWHKMHGIEDLLRRHVELEVKGRAPWEEGWIEIYDMAACRIGPWEVVIRKDHGLWYLFRVTLSACMGDCLEAAKD